MKRCVFIGTLVAALLATVFGASGCQKQASQNDAIREGIRQHLASLKTINLGAMEINLTSVSINGDSAQAQVEYVPKTGAPAGAGMRVAYSLQKRDQQWVVVTSNSAGGAIEHPNRAANPHAQQQGEMHGALPNFRELIPPDTAATAGASPDAHPAASAPQQLRQD